MMVTRRRQQPNGAFMPGLQEQEVLGGAPGEAESFWSSFSVVESLFSEDSMAGGGVIPFSGGRSIDTSTTSAPASASGGGGGAGGSRLPFMRQLKSQEAFPPLPPSSSPYIEDNNNSNGYGGNHHHHNGHHGSHRRGGGGGGGGHHQRRGGGGGSGEWITPHTNTNNSSAAPGHHLFPPVNGNTYYNAFNGYNQHFVGVSPAVVGGGSDGFAGDVSRHNGTSPTGSPHNTFSIFSGDYHPSSSRQQQGGSSGAIAIGQNAFTAVPDIGASIERHQSMSPFSRSPGGDSVLLSSSPSGGGLYSSSPSTNRKRSPAPSLTTTATTIIAPSSSSMKAPSSLNNKICCDEKALLEEELQSKGLPFSLLLALPNEHLLKIMSYLSGRDLANLQMVGKKRLAVLATDNGLWKELYLRRWKLLEILPEATPPTPSHHHHHNSKKGSSSSSSSSSSAGEESHDEWAWIHSLLQQNERWKDIFQSRHSAEKWRIGTLKMFNGCWGFISQHAPDGSSTSSTNSTNSTTSLINANMNNLNAMIASVTVSASGGGLTPPTGETLDIFFHRKDIAPEGDWYEDWWLKDTPGVSRSQKCGYWDTFLCGRVVRYKQRAAYAQGRRPQACNISFVGDERRERIPSLQYGVGGTLVTPEGMLLPPSMRFAPSPSSSPSSSSPPIPINNTN